MDSAGDKNLTQGIKDDEEISFELLFEKYHRQLYLLAVRYLRDEKLAEDAIQDVFLKVWEQRRRLDPSRPIKGFLFATLKNHVLNMIRSRKRRILNTIEAGNRKPGSAEETEDEIILNEYLDIVEKGLEKLPSGKQKVFRLRRLEGCTNQEVATRLHISVTTVKSQLYKATKFLRNFVETHADI